MLLTNNSQETIRHVLFLDECSATCVINLGTCAAECEEQENVEACDGACADVFLACTFVCFGF